MLSKLKKSNQKGFTIIEVMIVLAIAGLILLVVLLAVPALQRSSRNTAIKNDASALASGVTEYESNNNGTLPLALGGSTAPDIKLCDAGTCGTSVTVANVKVQGSDTVTPVSGAQASTAIPAGTIFINTRTSCDKVTFTNTAGADAKFVSTGGSSRSTAVIFSTEVKGGTAGACIDS